MIFKDMRKIRKVVLELCNVCRYIGYLYLKVYCFSFIFK